MPLPIPDHLFAAMERAAAPINPNERPRFLEAMAAELGKEPMLGEGVVYRCAANLQRVFPAEARREVEKTATARHLERRRQVDDR
jgi:hypothetical protein